eukprot:8302369-Alexandrium_andersonii.AAC.1
MAWLPVATAPVRRAAWEAQVTVAGCWVATGLAVADLVNRPSQLLGPTQLATGRGQPRRNWRTGWVAAAVAPT